MQWTTEWSSLNKFWYGVLRIFFPYMADWSHRKMRESHFEKLK